ncbi:MAG: ABC transporter ATP-binding protein [Desulfovibrionales bacterium]
MGRYLWKLLPFAKPYRRHIIFGLAANGMARFFDLLPLVIVGRVVDAITPALRESIILDPSTLALYGLAILGTFLGLAAFQTMSNYALEVMAQNLRHDLRITLYEHLQRLDVPFFENRQTGDIMSVVSNDVDNLENFLSDASTSIVRIVITSLGTFGFLLWLDWRLALLLFAPLPFAILAVRFFATKVQPQYRRARKAVGEVNSILENNLQGIGVIQAYTAESVQVARVEEQSAEYRDAAIAAARERARFIPLLYAIAGCAFGGLIGFGGWITMAGYGPSIGDYTTFVLMALRLVLPLFVFGMLINQIQRSEASAKRIDELLSTRPTIKDAPGAVALPAPPKRIVFDDIRFAYSGRETVLNGVSFTLKRGRMVGVVGPTGAGKSTLVKLLLRYYEPTTGAIRINGNNLSEYTLHSVRRHIGYVSQEAFLFFGTVAENIRLGSPGATHQQVREAARIAGAQEFIDELPQAYDTLVGERGVKLSGGQRQRISLARAVLRNPPLLILDEATSAVDTRTEEIIQRNLHHFRGDRMTLAVAHRLSTIRHSDEILVLVDGIVVERGDHGSLLQAGGVYTGLWNVQSGEL